MYVIINSSEHGLKMPPDHCYLRWEDGQKQLMPSMVFFWGFLSSCRAEESAPWPKCPRFLCPKAAVPIPIFIGDHRSALPWMS